MTPKCIADRDELMVKSIMLSHEVRESVESIVGNTPEAWEEVPIAITLMRYTPDHEEEYKEIIGSIHWITDDDIMWLREVVGKTFAIWKIFDEITKYRKHLLG